MSSFLPFSLWIQSEIQTAFCVLLPFPNDLFVWSFNESDNANNYNNNTKGKNMCFGSQRETATNSLDLCVICHDTTTTGFQEWSSSGLCTRVCFLLVTLSPFSLSPFALSLSLHQFLNPVSISIQLGHVFKFETNTESWFPVVFSLTPFSDSTQSTSNEQETRNIVGCFTTSSDTISKYSKDMVSFEVVAHSNDDFHWWGSRTSDNLGVDVSDS